MAKIIYLISFLSFYAALPAQKVALWHQADADLNAFQFFYMNTNEVDLHDFVDPFGNKKDFSDNEYKWYSVYYELSLKNLTAIDGISAEGTLLVSVYISSTMPKGASVQPGSYTEGDKKQYLVLALANAANRQTLWWGATDIKKLKFKNDDTRARYQYAIRLIVSKLVIEPVINQE